MKQKTIKTSNISIPKTSDETDNIEIRMWHGDKETRYDLIIRTSNSMVSHSLSHRQLKLLSEEIRKINL